MPDLNQLSRVTSHALRHEPWIYELELDDEGWTEIEALLAALRRERESWSGLTARDLADMIATSSKQRHEIVGTRIRALYGHSLPGKLRRVSAQPPELLFHGTAPATVSVIRSKGLRPMGRQYVHLSATRDIAVLVGKRKAPVPVILTVTARGAHAAGVAFYAGNDNVWLADLVPPQYIDFG